PTARAAAMVADLLIIPRSLYGQSRPPVGLVRGSRDVFPQQIAAEIAREISPDRVDVIAVVLRVVVLDEEGGALYAVIVLFALLRLSSPGKRNLLEAGRL